MVEIQDRAARQFQFPFAAAPPRGRRRKRPSLPAAAPGLAEAPDAADITRGALRLLDSLGFRTLAEMRLASGRRVDAIGLDGRGRFAVVEVKSSAADLRADDKWPDYLPFCDWFYFAVAPGFPLDLLPGEGGIIVADRYDGEIIQSSSDRRMNAVMRRHQTLLFARTAADRLFRVLDSEVPGAAQPGRFDDRA